MAAEPHYIDVDLKKSTHYKTTTVTQNDTDVVFILRVSDDGRSDESVLDNFSTVTLTSQRRDGQSFYVLGEKIPGTNEVRFALGTKELELTGKVSASAQLYSVDGRQSSAKFNYNVEGDLTGDYVPTETEITLIEVVLGEGPQRIAEAVAATEDAIEATAFADQTRLATETVRLSAMEARDSANDAAALANTAAETADTMATAAEQAAALATTEANDARAQKEEVQEILSTGPVASVNGQTGIVSGLATQESVNQVTAQLADKAKESDLEIERQRISNLTAHAGDTDGNAELLDIRVAFDGELKSTAGDAVRSIGAFVQDRSVIYPVAKNLVVDNLFTQGLWDTRLASDVSTVDGVYTILPSARVANTSHKITTKNDHVYYVSMVIETLNADTRLQFAKSNGEVVGFKNYQGAGSPERIAIMVNAGMNTELFIKTTIYNTDNFSNLSLSKPMVVDVTEIYGTGNEPIVADFEKTLAEYNDGVVFASDKTVIRELINVGKGSANDSTAPIYINKTGDTVIIRNKYNATEDLETVWRKFGANNIPNLNEINFVQNDKMTTSAGSQYVENNVITTDFIGPWRVRVDNNADGDKPTTTDSGTDFTGGTHGFDGGATGSATARNVYFKVIVDGRELTGDYSGFANAVELVWENMVQASNTKKADGTGREVIKERYRVRFDGEKYDVFNQSEILENMRVITYYGLQSILNLPRFNQSIFYHSSENRKKNPIGASSNSLTKVMDGFTLEGDNNLLTVEIDTSHGLGDRALVSGWTYGAFASSNKAYFWLLDRINLLAGDVTTYKGSYKFVSK